MALVFMICGRNINCLMTLALASLLVGEMVGCKQHSAMAQVRGKVVVKNGVMPKVAIRAVKFEPTGDSTAEIRKGAGADIEDDGSFVAFTRRPGDGVYLGDYAVSFSFSKSTRDIVPVIDHKYETSQTSPYKVKVDRDIDDLVFEIELLNSKE